MPVHDWTRVPSGLFHEFHQSWSVHIKDALNRGLLGEGYFALVEQRVDGPEPDVIAVQAGGSRDADHSPSAAVLDRPRASLTAHLASDAARYARKANRIAIHHPLGKVVAVIEIVSPGNKDSRNSFRAFVDKAIAFLRQGVHLLLIDLFPPTPRDPQGIHKAIWDELTDEPFALPAEKQLTLVAYQVADGYTAYIEPVGIGDELPAMPLFLEPELHVLTPLEATYAQTWDLCPAPIRELVLGRV